ncbi:hypothetical protein LZ554_005507 [Drepanopeziza brunnea f. sp. 'monogermtubi']|nr:hypothetical protein LZ554_005507 [Drepanopeziza brunnea f. sp. 'monogermtubi']
MMKMEKHTIEDLCSVLGYVKHHPTRDYKHLMVDIDAYFSSYETPGRYLGSRRILTKDAMVCATSYLQKESRAERFWPKNDAGHLTWPLDEHIITEAVGHIMRRKGISAVITRATSIRNKNEREEQTKAGNPSGNSPKKRLRYERDDVEENIFVEHAFEQLARTTSEPMNELRPRREPLQSPNPKVCIDYIRSLNPRDDIRHLADFTKVWLESVEYKWPISADKRLQTFMHNRELYINFNYGDDLPAEVIRLLTKGTEIEDLEDGLGYDRFQERVRDRVEYLTFELAKSPLFIVEIRCYGPPQIAKQFKTMWQNKKVHWDTDSGDTPVTSEAEPKMKMRKRQKRRAKRPAKSPVRFPNLDIQMEEQLGSSEKDQMSLMAESALRISTRQPRDKTCGQETSMMHGVVSQDLQLHESDALASTHSLDFEQASKTSVTPEQSIVVDCVGRAQEERFNKSLVRSKDVAASSPMTESQRRHGSISPTSSAAAMSLPVTTPRTPTDDEVKPGSRIESATETLDEDEDEEDDYTYSHNGTTIEVYFHKTETQPMILYDVPTAVPETLVASDPYHKVANPQGLSANTLVSHSVAFRHDPLLQPRDSSPTVQRNSPGTCDTTPPVSSNNGFSTADSSKLPTETTRPKSLLRNPLRRPSIPNPSSSSKAHGELLSHLDSPISNTKTTTPSKQDADPSQGSASRQVSAEERADVQENMAKYVPATPRSLPLPPSDEPIVPAPIRSSTVEIPEKTGSTSPTARYSLPGLLLASPNCPIESTQRSKPTPSAVLISRYQSEPVLLGVAQNERSTTDSNAVSMDPFKTSALIDDTQQRSDDALFDEISSQNAPCSGPLLSNLQVASNPTLGQERAQRRQPNDQSSGEKIPGVALHPIPALVPPTIAVDSPRPASPKPPKARLGSYAHIPLPNPFCTAPSKDEFAGLQTIQRFPKTKRPPFSSNERSIVKSNTGTPQKKTLELLIESADGELDLENSYSFDVVKNNTLEGFFSFYASVSKASSENLHELVFTPTWGNNQRLKVTRSRGDVAWKRLKALSEESDTLDSDILIEESASRTLIATHRSRRTRDSDMSPKVKVETASGGEADVSSSSEPKGKIGRGEIRYLQDQIRRQSIRKAEIENDIQFNIDEELNWVYPSEGEEELDDINPYDFRKDTAISRHPLIGFMFRGLPSWTEWPPSLQALLWRHMHDYEIYTPRPSDEQVNGVIQMFHSRLRMKFSFNQNSTVFKWTKKNMAASFRSLQKTGLLDRVGTRGYERAPRFDVELKERRRQWLASRSREERKATPSTKTDRDTATSLESQDAPASKRQKISHAPDIPHGESPTSPASASQPPSPKIKLEDIEDTPPSSLPVQKYKARERFQPLIPSKLSSPRDSVAGSMTVGTPPTMGPMGPRPWAGITFLSNGISPASNALVAQQEAAHRENSVTSTPNAAQVSSPQLEANSPAREQHALPTENMGLSPSITVFEGPDSQHKPSTQRQSTAAAQLPDNSLVASSKQHDGQTIQNKNAIPGQSVDDSSPNILLAPGSVNRGRPQSYPDAETRPQALPEVMGMKSGDIHNSVPVNGPVDAPLPKVRFIVQKVSGALDYSNPLPSIRDTTVSGLFEMYSRRSGYTPQSLPSVTFDVLFAGRSKLVLHRSDTEAGWQGVKRSISCMFADARVDKPVGYIFDVWVKAGDHSDARLVDNDEFAGL